MRKEKGKYFTLKDQIIPPSFAIPWPTFAFCFLRFHDFECKDSLYYLYLENTCNQLIWLLKKLRFSTKVQNYSRYCTQAVLSFKCLYAYKVAIDTRRL